MVTANWIWPWPTSVANSGNIYSETSTALEATYPQFGRSAQRTAPTY
jgi:hypothetical protein